jgi:hypothetical protein
MDMTVSRAACLVLITVLALAGCTRPAPVDPPVPTGPAPGPPGPDRAVLDHWRDFPVRRTPRPVIVLGELSVMDGLTTALAKEAAAQGRYELTVPLPTRSAGSTRVRLPDGPVTVPLITARAAFDALRALPEPVPPAMLVPALTVTRVELGTAEFLTDRGRWRLPAWLFHVREGLRPVAWLALDPALLWRPARAPRWTSVPGNSIGADGVTLTVILPAPDPKVCPGDPAWAYYPVAIESPTAVAVGVRGRIVSIAPGRRDYHQCGYDVRGHSQPYRIRLAEPLGNRVVLNARGNLLPVTTP